MRDRGTSLIAAACVAALALGCSDGSVVQPDDPAALQAAKGAGPVVQMVTGSGHYVSPPIGLQPNLWRTFTMTARKYADGSVVGTYNRILHLEGGGVEHLQGPVTCFTLSDDGKTAWVGGMAPDADPPDLAWQIVDNGEGSGAEPDQVGLQIPAGAPFNFGAGFAQWFCDEQPTALDFGPPFGVLPLSIILPYIESGNMQIKP